MIRDFFIKKENIFIFVVAFISIFFVVLGFLFLFFKTDSSDGPRVIPNNVSEIVWESFSSKILGQKIEYPEYMYIKEEEKDGNFGLNITEFEPREFLNYFSNQNNVSFFPGGIDTPLFYGKIKESDYTSSTGQNYKRTEYLTIEDEVWAVMLIPTESHKEWQSRGFIWIQSKIQLKEQKCITDKGMIIDSLDCDPYTGQKMIYSGKVSDQFLRTGYEIINKNSFK